MLNRSESRAMSASVLKALPGNLDIKRHSTSILYLSSDFVVLMMPVHLSRAPCVEKNKVTRPKIACISRFCCANDAQASHCIKVHI